MTPKFIKLTSISAVRDEFVNVNRIIRFFVEDGKTMVETDDQWFESEKLPAEILALIEGDSRNIRQEIRDAIEWNERQTFSEAKRQIVEDNAN